MCGILEAIQVQLDRIEARLAKCAAPSAEMVDQRQSPLGRRRHCAAVRRLAAEGDGRVAIVGKKHLMTSAALAEELARVTLDAAAVANDAGAPGAAPYPPVESDAYQRALALARAVGASR